MATIGLPGHRSFDHQNLTAFPDFSQLSDWKHLSFCGNPLRSLRTLPTLVDLTHLDLTGTRISSFEGASVQPNLTSVVLNETPLARRKHLTEMCLIALGPALEAVNGLPVTDGHRRYARRNGGVIGPYLVRGWLLAIADPIRIVHDGKKVTLSLFSTPPRPEEPEEAAETERPSSAGSELEPFDVDGLPHVVRTSKRWNRSPRIEKPKRPPLVHSTIAFRIRMRYPAAPGDVATPTSRVVQSQEIERLRQWQSKFK